MTVDPLPVFRDCSGSTAEPGASVALRVPLLAPRPHTGMRCHGDRHAVSPGHLGGR